ncbi:MAG: hypothetical protein NT154_41195 [Verrucomicrobia bacterium]|nr:hypothetical protein [Verrucomicrobiota bacterium]
MAATGEACREHEGVPLSLVIVDLEAGVVRKTLARSAAPFTSVAISTDDQFVGAGDEQGTVRVWKVATGELARTFFTGNKVVRGVAFAPGASSIAAVGTAGVVEIWAIETGQLLKTMAE